MASGGRNTTSNSHRPINQVDAPLKRMGRAVFLVRAAAAMTATPSATTSPTRTIAQPTAPISVETPVDSSAPYSRKGKPSGVGSATDQLFIWDVARPSQGITSATTIRLATSHCASNAALERRSPVAQRAAATAATSRLRISRLSADR